MNKLLEAMSNDMQILRYSNESYESFLYRLCYSALGQWCLNTAMNFATSTIGTTKHKQTVVLNDLLSRYGELFPQIAEKFVDTSNKHTSFSVNIRRIYEETGYLLTDSNNSNQLANYGRTIKIGDKFLFFGLPTGTREINGLGLISENHTDYLVSLKDFLIRDSLSTEDYFNAQFDSIDFCKKDIDLSTLEFFNPKSKNVPSMSWTKNPETECTIARKTEFGPFYRIMRISGEIQLAEEPIEPQSDAFISYEYRRLYFVLKAHYNNSMKASITKLDELYSRIRIGGHLPNREYYLLLLLSWPERNAFDKASFIIKNDLLIGVIAALVDIGIEVNGGEQNA